MYEYVRPRISLPDKCIKALDKWAENLNEEKKQDKKEE